MSQRVTLLNDKVDMLEENYISVLNRLIGIERNQFYIPPVSSSQYQQPMSFQSTPNNLSNHQSTSLLNTSTPSNVLKFHSDPQTSNMSTPSRYSVEDTPLLDPDQVINKYPKLLSLSSIGRLSVRLAYESYFGKQLMTNSTVFGHNDKPPLPRDLVFELKKKLLSLHPQFRSTPIEFEPYWSKCVAAINHSCAGLRIKEHTIQL